MEQFRLSCEYVEPHKLAIILRFSGNNYMMDPTKMSYTTHFQPTLIGYLNEAGLFYKQIPYTVSWQDLETYEIKLYSDLGSKTFHVKYDEWVRLSTTALYHLCHGVLFEGEQSIYLAEDCEPLPKAEFWKILYSLSIWDLDSRYQQALVDDLAGCRFECFLLSEPEDQFQELIFRLGKEELKVGWSDLDFEESDLSAIRKRMELALSAQSFVLGLPRDKYISCSYIDARSYYVSEEGKWEYYWDSYKALVSLSNVMNEGNGISGVCNPVIIASMLYQRLFEIASRFDKNTNKSGKSYRAQLFSPEIEDYMVRLRNRYHCIIEDE